MEHTRITLKEIGIFEKHLRLEEKSNLTVQKYIRDVSLFAEFLNGLKVTKESVIAFKANLIDKGYKARSINSMIASINALFSFLEHPELKIKSLKLQQQVFAPMKRN